MCVNLRVFSYRVLKECNGHIEIKGCLNVSNKLKWMDRIKLTPMGMSS